MFNLSFSGPSVQLEIDTGNRRVFIHLSVLNTQYWKDWWFDLQNSTRLRSLMIQAGPFFDIDISFWNLKELYREQDEDPNDLTMEDI